MATEVNVDDVVNKMRLLTKETRSSLIGEQAFESFPNISRTMAATTARPLEGRPAFVVGAGPSLDGTAKLLPECRKKGAVLAVNTAMPAIDFADMCVSVEPVDVSSDIDVSKAGGFALVMYAHKNTWERCVASERPTYWFSGPSTMLASGLYPIGVPMLVFNYAVTCAAVALARVWGADPIVLVGCDMAYDWDGGRTHAAKSGRGADRFEFKDDLIHWDFSDETVTMLRKANQEPPGPTSAVELPAWHDPEQRVKSSTGLLAQWDWLSKFADTYKGGQYINATGAGAYITDWEHVALDAALGTMSDAPPLVWSGDVLSAVQVSMAKELIVAATSYRMPRRAKKGVQIVQPEFEVEGM